jgi:hypothetical protein
VRQSFVVPQYGEERRVHRRELEDRTDVGQETDVSSLLNAVSSWRHACSGVAVRMADG